VRRIDARIDERVVQERRGRALALAGRAALQSTELVDELSQCQSTGPAVSRCPVSGRPSTDCTSRAASSSLPRSTPVA
jgi:hypothetical protein